MDMNEAQHFPIALMTHLVSGTELRGNHRKKMNAIPVKQYQEENNAVRNMSTTSCYDKEKRKTKRTNPPAQHLVHRHIVHKEKTSSYFYYYLFLFLALAIHGHVEVE